MSQTAGRALELLEIVVRSAHPLGLVEIAAAADLDKSTASRLLAFLEGGGFVRRDHVTRRYHAGPHLLSLAAMAMHRSDVRQIADPEIKTLAAASGETVSLHVRVGAERVCIGGIESQHEIRRVLPLGEPIALHLGPAARVILAYLPVDEQEEILRDLAPGRVDEIREQLDAITAAGYVATVDDRTVGVAAVSAPIFDAAGVLGSMSISGPAERWTPARMAAMAPVLVDSTRAVSSALGVPVPEARTVRAS